jgi:hypothetical protein
MRVPRFILWRLQRWAERERERRLPDFVIGGLADPYMLRWWVIPRNRWFNIYLHEVIRSDDDRALHDHPWVNASILIDGCYFEHKIADGGIHRRRLVRAGDIAMRRAVAAHRLEVIPGKRAISLFITGPRVREWGFHCPEAGWRHWEDFTAPASPGEIGRGCGEIDHLKGARGAADDDRSVVTS